MSFVLQLGTAVVEDKSRNNNNGPATLLAQELGPSTMLIETASATLTPTTSGVADDSGRSQLLQCLESGDSLDGTIIGSPTLPAVKAVSVTYPVSKANRDAQRIGGTQTNTTQVLTTRVISQKLPSAACQGPGASAVTPLMINASSHITHLSVNTNGNSTSSTLSPNGFAHVYPLQTTGVQGNQQRGQAAGDGVQGKQQVGLQNPGVHQKLQAVAAQQILSGQAVKAITTAAAIPNIQRIHVKTQNIAGQPQTMNLQKVKTVASVVGAGQQNAGVQRNSIPRIQTVQKSQVLSANAHQTQFAVNQVVNNNNVNVQQRVQQGNTTATLQKAQPIGSGGGTTNNSQKVVSQVYNSQKVSTQLLTSHSNHKAQHQQYGGSNQQQAGQGIQKLQGQQQSTQKTIPIPRQQVSTVNNVQKSGNSVAGIQKGQIQAALQQQQGSQIQKHGPNQASQHHPRSQSAAALQKSQTMASVNSNRVQTITNVCKSNSVPNISKLQQNSNVLIGNKQQLVSQSQQQIHMQPSPQLQQQLLHQNSQQIAQKQQPANSTSLAQRGHSITGMHQKVTTIATVQNNQRTPAVMNTKMQQQPQQQMLMRVSVPKSQAQSMQQGNLKSVPQKIANTVKSANSQSAIQQSVHRNSNSQPVKIIQQQQNVIGPQNAQKQPGCIKTIPPQKPAQRNHTQKVAGIKTSLNTNVTALKSQATVATVTQKASIKTLLPQQTIAPNMLLHKNPPIKIQQQSIQQKQLIVAPQYSQQARQQTGQIKTLLPVTNVEPRKDVENKVETESRVPKEEETQQAPKSPKSPVRRMPLPYECLQFVLQDHNYGAPPPRTPPPPSPPPHPKQQPINGAGTSTTTPQHPYIYGQVVNNTNVEDDAASAISSEPGREAEPEGEETETAPEGEGDDEDSVTRCICDFEHDDGYMICCDRCLVWQHVDCMGIDRSNIPDEYLCEICRPRRVDRQRARALQMRKREELLNSDTSSDTSSTSSADTDVGVNSTQKKRPLQQQVPRRKSDPPSQVRRLNNNNNNNNVAKRQRRDSHPRQSSAVRKKETTKRGPGKRKAKRRMSVEDKEEDMQDAWGSNMAPLRQWIERYEEAVTNHYSPELRARISSIKVNGTHNDLRQSNMNVIATGKCRLNVHSNNLRFLVATMYLPPNTPVVELRGKYMLSTQHRPSHPQGRQHAQRPGPFVFFYRLPRDGTEVCVDTRTYGNDARFVRRSCKPNAEVKHCIEKGTLHLYIVTTTAIEKNAEITIKHEQHDLLLSPNPNSPMVPIVCACNNPRECQLTSAGQLSRRGSNGALAENADGRERRRRGRRNTICEDSDPPPTVSSTSVTPPTPTPTPTVAPAPPRRTVSQPTITNPVTRQAPKEEPPIVLQQPQTSPNINQPPVQETKKDKKKMTREERKMEAIMKAFERLEKAEQRKQEVQARNAQRKESGGTHSDNDDTASLPSRSKQQSSMDRPLRRKRRKGRARTISTSQSQSSRRTRLNSADSDVSSGEESNSMQSPPLQSQTGPPSRDAPYSSHLHTPAKSGADGTTGTGQSAGHQGIPTAAGLLLALANSNAPGPSSPPLRQPTPVKSPTCDSGASSSSQSSTPSTPLSSACLLVAAAVGPLAPGFKFPKTKKVLMNEWLKESPDPPQANIPQVSPTPALPSTPLTNAVNPICRTSDFSLPTDPSAEFLTQSYAAKSLATLVQAANSVSGICDSPPQRRQTIGGNNNACPVSTGSAKKRWLRQAISEECDSPNSRPESPPASEMVAPPKKRRIARESLSSDNYTPPTTPTMLQPETVPNTRSLCSTEDDFNEQPQSPNTDQNDERQYEPKPIKEEINVDGEPMDSDEVSIQHKVSVDIPQMELQVKTEKESESVVVVKSENDELLKVEDIPMSEEVSVKCKPDVKVNCDFEQESKLLIKSETLSVKIETDDCKEDATVKREPVIKKEGVVVEKGTVEIIDQNEPDTEMEDLSSPISGMESDAILKQRVAEMRLEFGGSIAEIVNKTNDNGKSDDDKKFDSIKCHESKSDDNMSIDEFDVEAQMKKITGDDGNDYKEKVDTSSEKDKSMDGIEGLMESSKEDSESEDRDMDDIKYCDPPFKLFSMNHEERVFSEFDSKTEQAPLTEENVKEIEQSNHENESQKAEQTSTFVTSSEESIFESASSNMDTESVPEPPKIFHSIPPLSERIRKKADSAPASKTQLDFEAAIIESTIDMGTDEVSKNGEQKSMLSTALRELLEAKLDDESSDVIKNDMVNDNSITNIDQAKPISPEHSPDVQDTIPKTNSQDTTPEETSPKEEGSQPKEIKRLKDPRTVVPNNMPAPPVFKTDTPPPVKRKVRTLSISEYRKRKQQSSGTPPEPEPTNDASSMEKSSARGRSDSASSGTSSLSSDEEGSKMSLSLDLPSLTSLPLFTNTENDEKKAGEEGTIGWSAAPTLVERQRENLTERLKREFGLFLSDDEEERARKHGLTAEAILKTRKTSPPHPSVSSTPPAYPLPQLPPQPYIPPPGSASIHYPQFQAKPCPVPYTNFTVPQTTAPSTYPNPAPQTSAAKQQAQQFLVPQASQAPPGSNPYPPQFIPPTTTAVPVAKFSSATPPSGSQIFPAATGQTQKPFFNHPAPRS